MNKNTDNKHDKEKKEIPTPSTDSDDINNDNDKDAITKTPQNYSTDNTTNPDERILASFRELYHQAIIESIEILGKQVSEVVINYLEEKHSIQLEETVDNPIVFHEVLEDAINGGSRIVERKIIKTLNKKLKIKSNLIETYQSNFAESISRLKKLYLEGKVGV